MFVPFGEYAKLLLETVRTLDEGYAKFTSVEPPKYFLFLRVFFEHPFIL